MVSGVNYVEVDKEKDGKCNGGTGSDVEGYQRHVDVILDGENGHNLL